MTKPTTFAAAASSNRKRPTRWAPPVLSLPLSGAQEWDRAGVKG